MIKIQRPAEPPILSESSAVDRWGHDDVREALHKMQYRKCCYCERLLDSEGSNQQIEHFWPKTIYPEKQYQWDNLLLACGRCNRKKHNKFPTNYGNPVLIDPADDNIDPEDHIKFVVGRDVHIELIGGCFWSPGSARGEVTIKVLDLWGYDHHYARNLHFRNTVLPKYKLLLLKQSGAKEEFEELMSAGSPLAAFVRAFATDVRLKEHGLLAVQSDASS